MERKTDKQSSCWVSVNANIALCLLHGSCSPTHWSYQLYKLRICQCFVCNLTCFLQVVTTIRMERSNKIIGVWESISFHLKFFNVCIYLLWIIVLLNILPKGLRSSGFFLLKLRWAFMFFAGWEFLINFAVPKKFYLSDVWIEWVSQ